MKDQTREQEVLLLISKGLTLPRVAICWKAAATRLPAM
jgi:hypothetical protein